MEIKNTLQETANKIEKIVSKHLKEDDIFIFSCYADNILTYTCGEGYNVHEISIISDGIMFRDMGISGILSVDNISYIDYKILNMKSSYAAPIAKWTIEE